MKDIFIITCYQFEITRNLVELLGRDNCYLVVDSRPDEYLRFQNELADRILVAGNFGYYTIDEAIGRLEMIRNLMKVTKGNFNRVHVISQNDLPTAGFFNRWNILDSNTEYVHINVNGWMSNYFSVTPGFCDLLNSNYDKCIDNLRHEVTYYNYYKGKNRIGALSELLWVELAKSIPNRLNDDLRLQAHSVPKDSKVGLIKGIHPDKLGYFTKMSSPITFIDSPELRELLKDDSWWIFARKFDFESDIYNWTYNQALARLENL